jgi:hypothetical protein
MAQEKSRYSDAELEEFKALINQKLIDALKVLHIDKKLRKRLSKNAKINILNNFTTKQFILDHVKVYQIA